MNIDYKVLTFWEIVDAYPILTIVAIVLLLAATISAIFYITQTRDLISPLVIVFGVGMFVFFGSLFITTSEVPKIEIANLQTDVQESINNTYDIKITDTEVGELLNGSGEEFQTTPDQDYVEYGEISRVNTFDELNKIKLVWFKDEYRLVYSNGGNSPTTVIEVEKKG